MMKKFLVDGIAVWVEDADFDLREKFKENVTVVDMDHWECEGAMEQYTATTFLAEARNYLSQPLPDYIKSAEKIWFAVVYAVKQLFLSCGGVDLKSRNALKYFFRFALQHSELSRDVFWSLHDSWTKAEEMHQDVYGSSDLYPSDNLQFISHVEGFVNELAKFDRKKLWVEFNKKFIVGSTPRVTVKKESRQISLGGFRFKSEYSVFV